MLAGKWSLSLLIQRDVKDNDSEMESMVTFEKPVLNKTHTFEKNCCDLQLENKR